MELNIPETGDGELKTGILPERKKDYLFLNLFPEKIRSYFCTTNWLERSLKELKDQLRIIGYMQSEE